jgi:putative membrane protein
MLPKRARPGCLGLIVTWLVSAGVLWLAARFVPGVHIPDFKVALGAAIVVGLVNTVVRPILVLLTLPVTLLTLGLFLLVVNGMTIGLAAWLMPGFEVDGLLPAILMAVVVSLMSAVVGVVLGPRRDDKAGA